MQTLSIDIETYSDVNLSKCGVYKYAESPDFEILLFGYSADDSDVTVIDLAQGERLPQKIIEALTKTDTTSEIIFTRPSSIRKPSIKLLPCVWNAPENLAG